MFNDSKKQDLLMQALAGILGQGERQQDMLMGYANQRPFPTPPTPNVATAGQGVVGAYGAGGGNPQAGLGAPSISAMLGMLNG
jgi:hypothetical protein